MNLKSLLPGIRRGAILGAILLSSSSVCFKAEAAAPFEQRGVWADTDGKHINAHGGGVLYHDGLYYWYGEQRPEKGFQIRTGVSCYVSSDLKEWRNLGVVLALSDSAGHDIERGCILERPKVIHNPKTGKFVMWFHLELKGRGYEAARAGVAVADSPEGPFRFLSSGRVNPGVYPMNMAEENREFRADAEAMEWWTPEWEVAVGKGLFSNRDLEGGQMSRDMTVFVDDDGKAYHVYSSEENLTLQIAELNDEYTAHTGRYIRLFPAGHNEAPAIFKHDGRYWMITSGCTGWDPNEARLMTATDIMGEWTQLPNPCRGDDADKTFLGQSTYVLPVAGKPGRFIAMFDVWRPKSLANSGYVWLPVEFSPEGTPEIHFRPTFDPDSLD